MLYIVEHALPIDPPIKAIIRAVVVLILVLWIVRLFLGAVPIAVPR